MRMREHRLLQMGLLTGALALALVLAAGAAGAASPAAAKAAKTADATKKVDTAKITYEDLGNHIGERITVHTTLRSSRTGTLTRVSKLELTLGFDTASGSTELTIPKENVAEIVLAPAPGAR